jgi:hypothetical protein
MKKFVNGNGYVLKVAGIVQFTAPEVKSDIKFGSNAVQENCYICSINEYDYNFIPVLAQKYTGKNNKQDYYYLVGYEGCWRLED